MRTPWIDLVALLQAAEDGDRVLDRRLVHHAPAGNGARARRPFRYTCGTRRASSRRCSAARRAPASASSRLPASMLPSVLPAPTMVCSSSMKRMMPALALADFARARLSAAPQIRRGTWRPRSARPYRARKWSCPCSPSGTSPRTMRCASPSAMAVLPTPGSPMSTGLFFVLRDRMRMTFRISLSRPMTGSSSFSRARLTRSVPYLARAS